MRKCQWIYSDRYNSLSVFGWGGEWKMEGWKDYEVSLGNLGSDGYVHYFDWGSGSMGVPKLMKLCTLNVCNLLQSVLLQ